jgi:hypothetical protein
MRGRREPDVGTPDDLGIELTRICELANEQGLGSEEIVRVLEKHVTYAERDLDSYAALQEVDDE